MSLELILLLAWLIAAAVQIFFWIFIFSKLAYYRLPELNNTDKPPVSIIVCAHNEEDNLKKYLPLLLSQEYPEYEVVIVNDFSSDNTLDVLLDFKNKYPILHTVNNRGKKHYKGKKAALELGISSSNFDLLLLTDADCYPTSRLWLDRMQAGVRSQIQIGLGFSPYEKQNSFLNAFIRFETLIAAIQYLSLAIIGVPYMGVGRNLIYKKSLFLKKGGFKSHEHIASGDDDLFVNTSATSQNTTVILDPLAFVNSIPKSSWLSFYNQKSRHLTTGTKYKLIHQLILGSFSLSHFLFYVLFVMLITMHSDLAVLLTGVYLFRLLIILWMMRRIGKLLKQDDLVFWFPLLDVSFVLYYFIFSQTMIFGNTNKW